MHPERRHRSSHQRLTAFPIHLLPILILLFVSATVSGQDVQTDRVQRVVDGDTVILAHEGRTRLIGVDTPESVRPNYPVERYGREAADYARRRLSGQTVRLEFDRERTDNHNRTLAYLYLSDGGCFNRELIARGFAFAYTLFPFKYRLEFLRLEDEARRSGNGMWAAVPPGIRNAALHGNRRSHVYHSSNCEYFDCRNCTIELPSRYEAERRGFKPHWACIGNRQSVQ